MTTVGRLDLLAMETETDSRSGMCDYKVPLRKSVEYCMLQNECVVSHSVLCLELHSLISVCAEVVEEE